MTHIGKSNDSWAISIVGYYSVIISDPRPGLYPKTTAVSSWLRDLRLISFYSLAWHHVNQKYNESYILNLSWLRVLLTLIYIYINYLFIFIYTHLFLYIFLYIYLYIIYTHTLTNICSHFWIGILLVNANGVVFLPKELSMTLAKTSA